MSWVESCKQPSSLSLKMSKSNTASSSLSISEAVLALGEAAGTREEIHSVEGFK